MSTPNIEKLSKLVVTPNGSVFDQNQNTNLVTKNLALQPDFLIFQFYPDENFDGFEIPFRQGNLIAFLNGFYPPSYNSSHQPQFYLSTVRENDAITNLGIEKGRIVFAVPRMKWKFPWDRLYLFHRSPGAAFFTIDNDSDTWSFSLEKNYTTPYLIIFGRDMDVDISGFESENSQRIGFASTFPNSNGTATIDVYHGRVKKNVDVHYAWKNLTMLHETRIVVKQVNLVGDEVIEHVNEPADAAGQQYIELSQVNSLLTRVQVEGGGAGETANIRIVVELKE